MSGLAEIPVDLEAGPDIPRAVSAILDARNRDVGMAGWAFCGYLAKELADCPGSSARIRMSDGSLVVMRARKSSNLKTNP